MQVHGQIVVVTGGAHGIGRALCERFAQEGAGKVVVADVDVAAARDVAERVHGAAFTCDVANETDIVELIDDTERQHGPIGLFCSNAGIARMDTFSDNAASGPNEDWERSWAV
jgi:NAD(P)-dependent dehydrogenase (short-subunit alcohol dehydrogenase family)